MSIMFSTVRDRFGTSQRWRKRTERRYDFRRRLKRIMPNGSRRFKSIDAITLDTALCRLPANGVSRKEKNVTSPVIETPDGKDQRLLAYFPKYPGKGGVNEIAKVPKRFQLDSNPGPHRSPIARSITELPHRAGRGTLNLESPNFPNRSK